MKNIHPPVISKKRMNYPHSLFVLPILLCLLLFAGTVQAEEPAISSESSEIQHLIEIKQRELSLLEQADAQLQNSLKEALSTAESVYDDALRNYEEAQLAHGLSGGTPMYTRSATQRLGALNDALGKASDDLSEMREQVKVRLERIGAVDVAPVLHLQELNASTRRMVDNYLSKLKAIKSRLERQDKQADKLQSKLDKLKTNIRERRTQQEEELVTSWRDFFFRGKAPLLSVELWRQSDSIALWATMLGTTIMREVNLLISHAFSSLLFGVGFVSLLSLGGIPLLRAATRNAPGHSPESMRALHTACFIGSAGLATIIATMRIFAGATIFSSIIGMFLLGFAAIRASAILRRMLNTGFTKLLNTPAAVMFLFGSLLVTTEMPSKLAVPLWTLLLIAYGFYMAIRDRRRGYIDSIAKRSWFWLCVFLLLISVAGYGVFSAFLFMVWFIFYAAYCFSIAMTELIHLHGASDMSDSTAMVMAKGVLVGFASPAVWLLTFLAALIWLYFFVGEGVIASVANLELSWEGFSLKLASLVLLAALFYITRACTTLARGALSRMSLHWPRGQRGAVLSLQTTASYALWGIYGLIALHILGVSLTSLTVIAGGLSVGLGFGMQTIFNNFMSGLILLFGRSIQQGDIIQVGNLWCTVKSVTIRTTIVETFDSATILIPNSDLVTTQVTNWTKNNSTIRRDVAVGVAYGSDTRKAEKHLLAIAKKHPHVLQRPAPQVIFSNFGASSLDFILRVWVDDIDNVLTTESALRFAIDDVFRNEDIEIAFPQLDLHVRSLPPAWQTVPQSEAPVQPEPEQPEQDLPPKAD